jgi:uncharacterized protein YecE (DUF72 family)
MSEYTDEELDELNQEIKNEQIEELYKFLSDD